MKIIFKIVFLWNDLTLPNRNHIFANKYLKDSTSIYHLIPKEDSITSSSDSIIPSYISLFGTSKEIMELKDRGKEESFNYSPDWLSLSFVGVLVYLILSRFLFRFNFSESLKGLFKIESLDQVSFEKLTQTAAFVLAPISSIIYAYYIYFFINPIYLKLDLDYLFLVFCFIISVLFFLKVFLEKIISLIFKSGKTFQSYFSDQLYVLGVSGLFQLPFLIIFAYSHIDVFLWIAIGILVLFWAFRLLRGFVIGYNQTGFYKSYIFLYLCSLEILPMLWAYKWLINNQ